MKSIVIIAGLLLGTPLINAAEPGVVDTGKSPYATVQTIGLDEAHWTSGFWADRFELCNTTMLPSMGRLMEGTNYSQFFVNFEIGVVVHTAEDAQAMKTWAVGLTQHCREAAAERVKKFRVIGNIVEDLSRLFAPLL